MTESTSRTSPSPRRRKRGGAAGSDRSDRWRSRHGTISGESSYERLRILKNESVHTKAEWDKDNEAHIVRFVAEKVK